MKILQHAKSFGLIFIFFSSISLFADSPKYVFLFLGDGMGKEHLSLGRQAAAFTQSAWYLQGLSAKGTPLVPPEYTGQGLTGTNLYDGKTTDSAASATAIACGFKTQYLFLGIDPQKNIIKSLGYMAREMGWKVGIISSEGINHASPAAFYAHAENRSQYGQIALEMHLSGFDYFGGAKMYGSPLECTIAENALKNHGYVILHGKNELRSYKGTGKLYCMSDESPDFRALSRTDDDDTIPIALQLETALNQFGESGGFFLFAEGAKIDHAAHQNDAGAMLGELREFNDAVALAFQFALRHPAETLIVITADHNTGGFHFLSADGRITESQYQKLAVQKKPLNVLAKEFESFAADEMAPRKIKLFETLLQFGADHLGISAEEIPDAVSAKLHAVYDADPFRKNEFFKLLVRERDRQCGIGWTTGGHLPDRIVTTAFCTDAAVFNGEYENSDICRKIVQIAFPDAGIFREKEAPAAPAPEKK